MGWGKKTQARRPLFARFALFVRCCTTHHGRSCFVATVDKYKGGREERIGGNDAAPSSRCQRSTCGSPSPRPLRGQRVPARRSGADAASTDGRNGRRSHGCAPACRRAPARPQRRRSGTYLHDTINTNSRSGVAVLTVRLENNLFCLSLEGTT